jgi:nicotinamide riboside kinase
MAGVATEHDVTGMSIGGVICITGTECTGKSTLARQLADALAVPLVTEVARDYLAGRHGYDRADVLAIARAQRDAEAAALATADLVVADTDLSVIQVWWEEKYGPLDPWLAEALMARSARRYLLTRPDIAWEPDPLRESPHDRQRLHRRYLEVLAAAPFPFAEIGGLGEARLSAALAALTRLSAPR